MKEKPSYSIRQNIAYVIKHAWTHDKTVLLIIAAQILLAVGIAVLSIFLPATVVEQITMGAPVETLVFTVLGFTAAGVLLYSMQNYFDATDMPGRMELRTKFVFALLEKGITADYANLEEKSYTDARQKATEQTAGNSTSTEQVYYCLTRLGTNLLGFVVYIILLAVVNPFVLIITAATAVLGTVAREWVNRWEHRHDGERAKPNKRLWHIVGMGEKYGMAKDIRLFGMVDWLRDIFNANMRLAYNFARKVETKHLIADGVTALAAFAREGIAYAYLIWLVLGGELTVDGFVLLFAAVGGFSGWVSGILEEFSVLSRHSLNICRVREFLSFPDKFRREGGVPVENAKNYALTLKNVTFRYSGADENALENINLEIKPGEKLAVVGLNGAGKTTLVKLLCGLYDPTEGEVLLNGKDIREFNRDEYYTLFTAVFQEFCILPITVAENISQQEQTDHKRVAECVELAGLTEKINSLPEGTSSLLNKEVHPEGAEFSGGETQRLMLARALYKNAPVLILDEPTAALDPIAESALYERYNELSYGRTSVYISHRLASTRFCDRIILIENKSIFEEGTHDELMRVGGRYAELFNIQSKYYQNEPEGAFV